MGALVISHCLVVVFLLQLIPAALLPVNRFVPPALTLLMGPVIGNILLFHRLMAPGGLGLALLVIALWLAVFLSVRSAFEGLFPPRVPVQ